MIPANSSALRRWPAIAAAIHAATPPAVQIAPTPQQTLIVDGLQLTSGYSRIGEAVTQASMVGDDLDEAWCYGIGLGELPAAMLSRCKRLHVVVMNAGIARVSLSAVRHSWLDSPNVELHLARDLEAAKGPFAVSPVELRKADADAVHVRDQLQAILNAELNRKFHAARKEVEDAHRAGNAEAVANDAAVTALFDNQIKYENLPVIACMGGPTLAGYFDWIRERKATHVIVAASTALKPLLQEGIIPDYVCVIDSAPNMVKHFEVMPSEGSTLVYAPEVNPRIVSGWRGPRYHCRIDLEAPDLYPGGSVLFTAVDLAVKMGAREVTLIGADLCFPAGKSHVDGAVSAYDVSQAWRPTVTNGRGEQVRTEDALMLYAQGLTEYVKAHPEVKFKKMGRDGVGIAGVEWVDD